MTAKTVGSFDGFKHVPYGHADISDEHKKKIDIQNKDNLNIIYSCTLGILNNPDYQSPNKSETGKTPLQQIGRAKHQEALKSDLKRLDELLTEYSDEEITGLIREHLNLSTVETKPPESPDDFIKMMTHLSIVPRGERALPIRPLLRDVLVSLGFANLTQEIPKYMALKAESEQNLANAESEMTRKPDNVILQQNFKFHQSAVSDCQIELNKLNSKLNFLFRLDESSLLPADFEIQFMRDGKVVTKTISTIFMEGVSSTFKQMKEDGATNFGEESFVSPIIFPSEKELDFVLSFLKGDEVDYRVGYMADRKDFDPVSVLDFAVYYDIRPLQNALLKHCFPKELVDIPRWLDKAETEDQLKSVLEFIQNNFHHLVQNTNLEAEDIEEVKKNIFASLVNKLTTNDMINENVIDGLTKLKYTLHFWELKTFADPLIKAFLKEVERSNSQVGVQILDKVLFFYFEVERNVGDLIASPYFERFVEGLLDVYFNPPNDRDKSVLAKVLKGLADAQQDMKGNFIWADKGPYEKMLKIGEIDDQAIGDIFNKIETVTQFPFGWFISKKTTLAIYNRYKECVDNQELRVQIFGDKYAEGLPSLESAFYSTSYPPSIFYDAERLNPEFNGMKNPSYVCRLILEMCHSSGSLYKTLIQLSEDAQKAGTTFKDRTNGFTLTHLKSYIYDDERKSKLLLNESDWKKLANKIFKTGNLMLLCIAYSKQ